MTLPPHPNQESRSGSWEDLAEGIPTLVAFARLCGSALAEGGGHDDPLSPEAQAILFAARQRGILEIRGVNTAFEGPARLLAVHVEQDDGRTLIFRSRQHCEITVRFLDGFRQLCAAGLVMHHIYRDFSLTRAGFELSRTIAADEVQGLLDLAAETSHAL